MSSRWRPGDRLAVVDRLQAQSGATSASFFDAHDLGTAYRSAGDKSSKQAKINAALHAADQRGDLDEILDAAADFLAGVRTQPGRSRVTPRPAPLSTAREVSDMSPDRPIFLSHAYADKALADLLRNTLVLGGVPEGRIFYSSDRSTGIPSGEDVGTYLRRSLQDAGLVIELVSQTFLTRPMCLMELGGAWALGTSTYPIVVPPLTRDEATKQIGNVQAGVLGTDSEIDGIFDELHDRLARDLGIQTTATAWNREIASFRQQLPAKLAAVQQAAAAAAPPPQVAAVAASPSTGDRVTVANISIVGGSLGRELHAEATNQDTVEHTASFKATFYSVTGTIVGTADALVSQLPAGRTKTLSMLDIPDHDRAKVDLDTIL